KTLVFIEVKARKNQSENEVITSNQMKRISDASRYFLTKNNKYSEYNLRFDLIIFNSAISFKHIKNAWNFF
ncbi:MAG: YraN family protein, partial [Rickettsiales bacterium]|nr:YraN family protein [Rickettsiales bacterium]